MSEINVTPFVDVFLVLLVVFMVTAPLLAVGVPVDLPQTEAASLEEKQEPITISIDLEGNIYVQETEVSLEDLVPRLLAISRSREETRIYVRGDKNVEYGRVLIAMGQITAAGFSKVALISELPPKRIQ
ncbi:MAG TPA: protein TolR [Sneathiellales bacterium]|nr:protein TolR [Sneathiellales bacterium]